MFNKKHILIMFLLLTVVVISTGCSQSKDTAQESSLSPFEEWYEKELEWPEWAEPVEIEVSNDIKYGPSVRKTFDVETARKVIGQLRYLVENSEDTDEYPYHNVWKFNLGSDLLKLGEYKLAYHYLNDIVNLPPNANYGTDTVDGKEVIIPISESDHQKIAHGRMLKSLAKSGFKNEVITRYKEYGYEKNQNLHSWGLTSAAWSMGIIGDKEEAYKLFKRSIEPENFVDASPYQASSNALAAASYAYAKGDYDKVLEFTERLVSQGISPLNPAYFVGENLESDKKDYFNRHWNSTYKLAETFRDLANKAKNGEVASFKNLKDGVYTSSNTGYMLTQINVEVTINDGKVVHIKATQQYPKDDRSGAAIETLPPRILQTQSLDVDAVSSATISSESVKLGVAQALLKAKK